VLAAVRSFLRPIFRALGVQLELSDAEIIRDYLMPARDLVRRGVGGQAAAGVPAFARAARDSAAIRLAVERKMTDHAGRISMRVPKIGNVSPICGDSAVALAHIDARRSGTSLRSCHACWRAGISIQTRRTEAACTLVIETLKPPSGLIGMRQRRLGF